MTVNSGMFSSNTPEWETPQDFFDELDREFHFNLDVCATPENAKCNRYFTVRDSAFLHAWVGTCWMNPPYGREIGEWVKKAYSQAKLGNATVVCLVPARTDTRWFQDYCLKGEIRFIRGRLKFGGSKNSAPFPSAVVISRGDPI